MIDYVVSRRPLYTGALAHFDHDPDLIQALSFEDRFGEPFSLWEPLKGGSVIGVAREACPLGLKDGRARGIAVEFSGTPEPRDDEQERMTAESFVMLRAGHSHIIEAPTGFGKTAVAAGLISRVGVTTLVMVHKADLMDMWRQRLHEFLGVPAKEVGVLQGDTYPAADCGVAVGMIQSAWKPGRYPSWVYRWPGLVVFDEVHRIAADKFSRVCARFPAALRLGLTATSERTDGRGLVFLAHIGPVAASRVGVPMIPDVLVLDSEFRLPRDRFGQAVEPQPGKTTWVDQAMARDFARNDMLARLTAACYAKKRNLVLFTKTLDHLDTLRSLVRQKGVPSTDVSYYVGGMSKRDREAAKTRPVVLATYKMGSEGTDCPWWDACILATPLADVRQVVGRVLRSYPGKKTPVVMDVVDHNSGVWHGYARKRRKYYRSIGAPVSRVQI